MKGYKANDQQRLESGFTPLWFDSPAMPPLCFAAFQTCCYLYVHGSVSLGQYPRPGIVESYIRILNVHNYY